MLCLLLYISPSISLWPHSVQGCDAARRSLVQRQTQQPLRAVRSLQPGTCRHVYVEKHETEKICGAHAHSFPTAHESCLPLFPTPKSAAAVQWGEV